MNADEVQRLVQQANAADAAAAAALARTFDSDRHLAVYGTLAPGEPNHHQLAPCRGHWAHGQVRGRRVVRTFPVFTYDPTAPWVPVQWLASAELPQHWRRLEEFEGDEYRRILVPVFAAGQLVTVANLFAAFDPV